MFARFLSYHLVFLRSTGPSASATASSGQCGLALARCALWPQVRLGRTGSGFLSRKVNSGGNLSGVCFRVSSKRRPCHPRAGAMSGPNSLASLAPTSEVRLVERFVEPGSTRGRSRIGPGSTPDRARNGPGPGSALYRPRVGPRSRPRVGPGSAPDRPRSTPDPPRIGPGRRRGSAAGSGGGSAFGSARPQGRSNGLQRWGDSPRGVEQ